MYNEMNKNIPETRWDNLWEAEKVVTSQWK